MSVPLRVASTSRSEPFAAFAARAAGGEFRAESIETVQVNIGLACNLACAHCHVESSPLRRERMEWPTMLQVLELASSVGATTIDITGGAPEMHPRFRDFVSLASQRGFALIVRTNLTILLRPGFTDLPQFLAERRVRLTASLPCYQEERVDRQRGTHVYRDSITALRRLNELGYGLDEGLILDLVYNPIGATLPPAQARLEEDYRQHLRHDWGIAFTHLFAIANMPIGRFQDELSAKGEAEDYARLLRESSRPENVRAVMCRRQIHVAHDGSLHDCDFNYALGLELDDGLPQRVGAMEPERLATRSIRTAEHCYGCTAGNGSSCGGALR